LPGTSQIAGKDQGGKRDFNADGDDRGDQAGSQAWKKNAGANSFLISVIFIALSLEKIYFYIICQVTGN